MRAVTCVGFLLAFIKLGAFWLTGSSAVLSDAIESFLHLFAVGFATYSTWLILKGADRDHTYGHDRIAFFSAGLEGVLILIASFFIGMRVFETWKDSLPMTHLDWGIGLTLFSGTINLFLARFLTLFGKKRYALVVEAHGSHLFADALTGAGVLVALVLTRLTGLHLFDPLIAFVIALNIFWMGSKLVFKAVLGLMDHTHPALDRRIRKALGSITRNHGVGFHALRHRNAGSRLMIEVHLLFSQELTLAKAHAVATLIEKEVEEALGFPLEFVSHLEPLEGHDEIHTTLLGRGG